MKRHLGKLPARHDHRVPRMAAFLPQTLPAPPDSADWISKVPSWGPMGNLTAGCCALSAVGHIRQQQTMYASGVGQVATDEQVLGWYSALTGYDPRDPSTDRGTVMADALTHWLNPGFAVGPASYEKITAYCSVQAQNRLEVERCISWFGSVYVGIQLPLAWQRKGAWDVGPAGLSGDWEPGSWGGHAIPCMSYNDTYVFCVTWGQVQAISWQAFHSYVDECYATLSLDWQKPPGFTPSGVAWTELIARMDALRSGGGA